MSEENEDLYYWEQETVEEAPPVTKAWHWTHWIGHKTLEGMEFSGEVIATFLGLTRSKYQWILDAKEREEEEEALRLLESKQRRQLKLQQLLEQEKAKLKALETGNEVITDDYSEYEFI